MNARPDVCSLWCPRQPTQVTYVGVVKDHGWTAAFFACARCLDRLHRTVDHVRAYGQSGRCWLWCGGHSSAASGAEVIAIGTVEVTAGLGLPRRAKADIYSCTDCIRLISTELQRLAYLRDGCTSPDSSEEYSPGGHLASAWTSPHPSTP